MSRTFKDADGREWIVSVDVNALERVQDATGILLTDLVFDNEVTDKVTRNPITLAKVFIAILLPQITVKQLTPETFKAAFCGDTMEAATEALLGALADFSPSAQRGMLLRAQELFKPVTQKQQNLIRLKLEQEAAKQTALIDKLEQELTFSNSATNAPESSASNPAA